MIVDLTISVSWHRWTNSMTTRSILLTIFCRLIAGKNTNIWSTFSQDRSLTSSLTLMAVIDHLRSSITRLLEMRLLILRNMSTYLLSISHAFLNQHIGRIRYDICMTTRALHLMLMMDLRSSNEISLLICYISSLAVLLLLTYSEFQKLFDVLW